MSDLSSQINIAVTRYIKNVPDHTVDSYGKTLYKIDNDAIGGIDIVFVEDYCRSPNLTFPLLVKENLALSHSRHRDGLWYCYDTGWCHSVSSEEPLQAILLMFLKLKGVELPYNEGLKDFIMRSSSIEHTPLQRGKIHGSC